MRFASWLAVAVCTALLAGCSHTLTLNARVIEPAGIPVRAFPHVWVDRGELLPEQEVARVFVEYLQQTPGLHARLVNRDELSAARAGGTVPAASVLVVVGVHTIDLSRVEWTTRHQTVCDALGCFSVPNTVSYDIPVMEGELRISVQDAASGQELQRAVVKAREEGRSYDDMLPRLLVTLSDRLQRLAEQRALRVEVDLLEVDHPVMERALSLAEAGNWLAARDAVEALVNAGSFASELEREDQARALYDLSQLMRFATREGEGPLVALKASRTFAERALTLHVHSRYVDALKVIDEDIRRRTMVEDQRAAAEQNFAIDRVLPSPPPPSSPPQPSLSQTPTNGPALTSPPTDANPSVTGVTPETP